ncbi:MAG: transporter substrate-binding domain-containing protein, partial [Alphaproteobacteria bacterium]|nr:transporter substrate-binding domain-containing protein [Alphaproteobacteria bacterium]
MNSLKTFILVPALTILLAAGLAKSGLIMPAPAQAARETTYDRVLRTGTIRCGYSDWKPLFWVDPNTKEKKGIFADLTKEIGKRLGLKIVWQEELGWGSVVEAIKSGRVDMSCAGYWLNPARIKNLQPSVPQLYSPL